MPTRVPTKGQINLPAEIRQRDGIQPGQEFEVQAHFTLDLSYGLGFL